MSTDQCPSWVIYDAPEPVTDRARLTIEQLVDWMDRNFQRDAFRLEVLDRYGVQSDGDDVARYLAGEPEPDPERKNPWLAELRAEVAAGRSRRRVHVLHSPLSDYLRYECEWGYRPNSAAGEQIRILDLSERPMPEHPIRHDFWLLDDSHCAAMVYDSKGGFVEGRLISDIEPYRRTRDAVWQAAIPFDRYWAEHPQYWRDVSA